MSEFGYSVERLLNPTLLDVDDLNALLPQLSTHPARLTLRRVLDLITNSFNTIFVIRELGSRRIIGTSTLLVVNHLNGTKAWLENVIVDTQHRGRGLGRLATIAVILEAKALGISKLDLTSAGHRDGAHRLYENLGWVNRDSRLMRLDTTTFAASVFLDDLAKLASLQS